MVVYFTIPPVSSHPLDVHTGTAIDGSRGTGRAITLAVELESDEIIVRTILTKIEIFDRAT